ncbi:MAG: di-trans,poly-cis-decaprenylcistransferase [Acidobacteria bacterium]|nr:di-trans,poly-cis-decaprenylcistransferase [Acidobacteriota bacterium]
MIQSSLSIIKPETKLHVGIIMDGNGRWAVSRGLPRIAGHRAGADAVRRTVEACPSLGIGTLTLYAFSSDNWRRPQTEVNALMRLLRIFMRKELERSLRNGVRISVIGRRDRLSSPVLNAIETAEKTTINGQTLHLRIAIDYSSRYAILRAAERLRSQEYINRSITEEDFSRLIADSDRTNAPEVDLVIRTSGEQRLSDFLLWENAYAEFFFTKRMWPDFDANELALAVNDFLSRDRRFGALAQAVAG